MRLVHPVSDIDALFQEGFEAVLLAIGSHESKPLDIPGASTGMVHDGLAFLRSVSLGEHVSLGETVVVFGSGLCVRTCYGRCVRMSGRQAELFPATSERTETSSQTLSFWQQMGRHMTGEQQQTSQRTQLTTKPTGRRLLCAFSCFCVGSLVG